MNKRTHALFLAVAALTAALGTALWAQWGAAVWVADIAGWCA